LCNAQEQGRTIFDHKPTSSVAQSYLELAKTIETQLKRIQAKQAKIVIELSDTEVQAISDEVRADLN
jgi:nitrogenase subunit NifH